MEVIICIIALIIINWNIWDQQSKQASMQRQLETQHQQIQALKVRLEALEPKDEVETFMEKINKTFKQ